MTIGVGPKSMRLHLTKILMLSLGPLLFTPLFDADAETLREAVERALTGSPEIIAGELSLLEADEGLSRAKSSWKPDVSLKIKGGRKRATTDTTTSTADTEYFNPISTTLSVSQHLVDFGETRAGIEKSKVLRNISKEQIRQTRQEIIFEAITAYIAVWRDLKLLKVATSNATILGEQFRATEKRFSMREVTRTDVSQAQARLQGAISNRIAADLTLQDSLASYEEVIGPLADLEGISWSVQNLENYQLPSSIEAARDAAYAKNSGMKQLRLQHQVAKYGVLERRSSLLPTISIEASMSDARHSSATTERSKDLVLEGVVTVPLYDSGKSWSNLKSAEIETRILLQNEKSKKLTLDRKILSLWNTLQRTDGQISSIEASVEANKTALQGVRREVEVGTRTTLHLLDAENEYVQAEASLVSATHDKTQSHFSLMFECGLLDEVFTR